jgi:hypothetical protein
MRLNFIFVRYLWNVDFDQTRTLSVPLLAGGWEEGFISPEIWGVRKEKVREVVNLLLLPPESKDKRGLCL